MPRFFTLVEAEKLLPEVARSIEEAVNAKNEYETCEAESRRLSERVAMLGGVRVDRAEFEAIRKRRDACAQVVRDAVERIQDRGCLVKDLDLGLLDFPARWKGQEVYLCWRLGEDRIAFWHGVDEGFRGRKPIDDEFVKHLSGELSE